MIVLNFLFDEVYDLINLFIEYKNSSTFSNIISDICCYTLTLILNGHHLCSFCFHGIEFKWIVNVFIFGFFCV
jgi:hypothetical protein